MEEDKVVGDYQTKAKLLALEKRVTKLEKLQPRS